MNTWERKDNRDSIFSCGLRKNQNRQNDRSNKNNQQDLTNRHQNKQWRGGHLRRHRQEKEKIPFAKYLKQIYQIDQKEDALLLIGPIRNLIKEKFFTSPVRTKHSFIYSFAYLTMQNCPRVQLLSRMNDFVAHFFSTIQIEYDKNQLYKIFRYKDRKILTDTLQKQIQTQLQRPYELHMTSLLMQFVADFFQIHFIIIESTTQQPIETYYANGTLDMYHPILLLYHEQTDSNDQYRPIFSENNKIFTSSHRLSWRLYMILKVNPDVRAFRFPQKRNINLRMMKLPELQELAIKHHIQIKKLSSNKQNLKAKNKNELIDELRKKTKAVGFSTGFIANRACQEPHQSSEEAND